MNTTCLYSHKLVPDRVTSSKLRSVPSLGTLADHSKERISAVLPGWAPCSSPSTPVGLLSIGSSPVIIPLRNNDSDLSRSSASHCPHPQPWCLACILLHQQLTALPGPWDTVSKHSRSDASPLAMQGLFEATIPVGKQGFSPRFLKAAG